MSDLTMSQKKEMAVKLSNKLLVEYGWDKDRLPPVKFSNRLTRCAGKVHYYILAPYYDTSITYSLKYMEFCENFEEYLNDTVTHEIAHLIDMLRNGDSNHSMRWKAICGEMRGVSPYKVERCISYQVKEGVTGHSAKCDCRTHNLSTRMYNNIKHRGKFYKCRHCNEILIVE